MSFYSDFAGYYEAVFPLDEAAHRFVSGRIPRAGARVLDVGCGTGDYSGRLASEGHDVLGIDVDPEMVEAASRRFRGASFRVLDMGELRTLDGPFDVVFSIGNVLPHLPGERLSPFLQSLRVLLAPSAPWVFQTVNWDFILTHQSFRFPDVVSGRVVFEREYPEVADDVTRFVTRLTVDGRTVFEGDVPLYPVRAEDYARAHKAAGFELEAHYADFNGNVFDPGRQSSSVFVFRRAERG